MQNDNVVHIAVQNNDRHQMQSGPIGQLLIVIKCS